MKTENTTSTLFKPSPCGEGLGGASVLAPSPFGEGWGGAPCL